MTQKVVLVTGSRKGLGRQLSEWFLSNGNIVVGCSRSETDLQDANYSHHTLDVSEEKAVKLMIQTVKKSHGRIDYLINNAGIAAMNHFCLTPTTTFEKIFQTNCTGTFVVQREVSKLMMKQRYGRIVNFSTVAVPLRLQGEGAYAASKAAVVSMTQTSAKELGEFGITVNAVGPTPVDTDLIRAVPKAKIQELIDQQAIKRMGKFEDVRNVIEFFIRPESSFVTGQLIYLGGVIE